MKTNKLISRNPILRFKEGKTIQYMKSGGWYITDTNNIKNINGKNYYKYGNKYILLGLNKLGLYAIGKADNITDSVWNTGAPYSGSTTGTTGSTGNTGSNEWMGWTGRGKMNKPLEIMDIEDYIRKNDNNFTGFTNAQEAQAWLNRMFKDATLPQNLRNENLNIAEDDKWGPKSRALALKFLLYRNNFTFNSPRGNSTTGTTTSTTTGTTTQPVANFVSNNYGSAWKLGTRFGRNLLNLSQAYEAWKNKTGNYQYNDDETNFLRYLDLRYGSVDKIKSNFERDHSARGNWGRGWGSDWSDIHKEYKRWNENLRNNFINEYANRNYLGGTTSNSALVLNALRALNAINNYLVNNGLDRSLEKGTGTISVTEHGIDPNIVYRPTAVTYAYKQGGHLISRDPIERFKLGNKIGYYAPGGEATAKALSKSADDIIRAVDRSIQVPPESFLGRAKNFLMGAFTKRKVSKAQYEYAKLKELEAKLEKKYEEMTKKQKALEERATKEGPTEEIKTERKKLRTERSENWAQYNITRERLRNKPKGWDKVSEKAMKAVEEGNPYGRERSWGRIGRTATIPLGGLGLYGLGSYFLNDSNSPTTSPTASPTINNPEVRIGYAPISENMTFYSDQGFNPESLINDNTRILHQGSDGTIYYANDDGTYNSVKGISFADRAGYYGLNSKEEVKELQNRLNQILPPDYLLNVDGNFGLKTETALINYLREYMKNGEIYKGGNPLAPYIKSLN